MHLDFTPSRRLFFTQLLGVAAAMGPGRLLAQEGTPDGQAFDRLVSDFSRLRALAYSQVIDLKSMYRSSKTKLAESEAIYQKARHAADSWLDTARASVALGSGRPAANALQQSVKELHRRTDALVAYAEAARSRLSPKEGRKNLQLVTAVATLITSLVDVGLKVYQAWTSKDEKDRTQIREELERLRWSRFSDI